MFTNPYFIAIGIPIVLLLSGALAKKLVRGSSWQQRDFYLGVEFTLASMSTALVYIFDLLKEGSQSSLSTSLSVNDKLAGTAAFVAVSFFLLLWVLSTHQDWENKNDRPRAQLFWLVFVANLIGAGLLVSFVLFIKGVK